MAEQKSMDDVLASIRRIVIEEERAEAGKGPAVPDPDPDGNDPIPLPSAFRKPGDEPVVDIAEIAERVRDTQGPGPAREMPGADIPDPSVLAGPRPVEPRAPEAEEEFVLTSSMQAASDDDMLDDGEEELRLDSAVEAEPETYAETAPGAGADAAAGTEPATQADAVPEPEPVPAMPAFELDEEALTEKVRDIIRQELTGNFGATLSRNIQKLVQDEVRKALSGKD